jgi:hypothetical protein
VQTAQIEPSIAAELQPLAEGSVSQVAENGETFVVLKLVRHVAAVDKTFDEVRPEIESAFRRSLHDARVAQTITQLRAAANVENHIARRFAAALSAVSEPSLSGSSVDWQLAPGASGLYEGSKAAAIEAPR